MPIDARYFDFARKDHPFSTEAADCRPNMADGHLGVSRTYLWHFTQFIVRRR